MRRSSLYLALIVSSMSWPAAAEPVPLPKESPRDDALPAGAKLRLGGTRFRCSSRIQTVTFSPDGKILAGGGDDGLVVLWDRNTGHELRSWKCPCKYLHDLAFSPDGRFLASSSQMSKVFVWDPETGREVFNSGDNSYGYEFYAWLGARRIFLADWRSSTLQILEVPSGREERKWSLKTKYARFAASPDGKQIITLGTEGEFKKDSRLFFWDILANEPAKKFELPNPAGLPYGSIGHMVFSPDGQYFATTTDGGIVIWDAQTGKIAHHYPYPNRIFAFFLNNRFLLTSGGLSANILGVDSGKILRSCSTASNGISWGIISAAVTPDGQTLALPKFTLSAWNSLTSL